MQTGLHAIGSGLLRLGIVLGIAVFAVFFLYAIWVTLIVAGQAVSGS